MSKKKLLNFTAAGIADTETQKPFAKITRENHVDLGKVMIIANGGTGFVVVRDQHVHVHGTAPGIYKPTPREWGAWRAWRKSKGMSVRFIDQLGYATVPCQWPEGFDAEWPHHKSVDAANRWQDRVEAKQGKPRLDLDPELARSEGL